MKEWMASFGPPQVAALAILGVLALILGVWFLRWSTAPTWETVSSGLRPAEAADVIDELDKAGISNHGDIWGMVTWTEKKGAIAPEDQTLHLVQASQTSLGGFMAFCTTQGLLRSKGIGKDSTEIEVHAEARSKGSNKYTNFSFHPVK